MLYTLEAFYPGQRAPFIVCHISSIRDLERELWELELHSLCARWLVRVHQHGGLLKAGRYQPVEANCPDITTTTPTPDAAPTTPKRCIRLVRLPLNQDGPIWTDASLEAMHSDYAITVEPPPPPQGSRRSLGARAKANQLATPKNSPPSPPGSC